MVQGLEHQHDVEGFVIGGNGFRPTETESHVGEIVVAQICGVLDFIHLQRGYRAHFPALADRPGFISLAASQFKDVSALQVE